MDGGAWKAAVHGVAEGRTRLSLFTFMHWRRKWQPTPVLLPGESQGRGSLVGCHLWGHTERTRLKRVSSSSSSSSDNTANADNSLCLGEIFFVGNIVVVVQLLSCVQLFVTQWTVARQAPLSMG